MSRVIEMDKIPDSAFIINDSDVCSPTVSPFVCAEDVKIDSEPAFTLVWKKSKLIYIEKGYYYKE